MKERLFAGKEKFANVNVFLAPNPHELRELATGEDGSLKKLNDKQLQEVRRNGTFSVPSKNFPGATHCWKITQFLQRGNELSNNDFKAFLARAYYFTFFVARNRVIGRVLSIRDAVENIGYAFHFVYNSLIGGQIRNPNYNLDDEMFSFLTSEIKVSNPNELKAVAVILKRECETNHIDLFETKNVQNSLPLGASESAVLTRKCPHVYTNKDGANLNLFAVTPWWLGRSEQNIFQIVSSKTKSNYPPRRVQKLIKEYREKGMQDDEIVATIQKAFDQEYLNSLIVVLREKTGVNESVSREESEVIETYLRGLSAIQESIKSENVRIKTTLAEIKKSLQEKHTIRSKCNEWLEERMEQSRQVVENNENTFVNLLAKLRDDESIGPEWNYFIQRAEEFHNTLPQTIARLSKENYTTVDTVFRRRIWNPKSYIVKHNKTGERKLDVQIVDTKIGNSNVYNYSMDKWQRLIVTSKYPGWRWRKYFVSFYTWFMNLLFFLLVGMVLRGPFSLSALFLWYEYPTNYTLDNRTGNVYPNSFGKTLITIVRSLWRDIAKRRLKFERKPDTGFLPKNMTRFFNRLYLYVIYGFFGTLLFLIFFPLICVFLILIGIVLLLTLPIWYLMLSLIIILLRTLIYDWQYEDGTARNPKGKVFPLFYFAIYKIGIRVCLQLIISVVVILLMPLLSILTVILACMRRSARYIWDLFIFVVVIKTRARVPVTNSFVARRISGPGLATDYYYQINPSQALIKFEYNLEAKELALYEIFIRAVISQPAKTYHEFINNLLRPLGYVSNLKNDNPQVKQIRVQRNSLRESVDNMLRQRREEFQLMPPSVTSSTIRMVKRDLDSTVLIATGMIEEFYTKRILVYPSQNREEIFQSHGLETNDWEGLAKVQLSESFSPSFLSPLEDSDESFHLDVEKLGLEDYIEAITGGEARHDLDKDRMITVDKEYSFLPGINLIPKYDFSWANSDCDNLVKLDLRKKLKRKKLKRNTDSVRLVLTRQFYNKLGFTVKLAERVGWERILSDDYANPGDVAEKKEEIV